MDPLTDLLGESEAILALRCRIERLVRDAASGRPLPPVLLEGETGTGKGLVARVMHQVSARAQGPFIDVNCAAIPDTLLEAELFGYERGAFTGAQQSKPGLFQSAHHGTLFLDEIGLLPEPLQAKLLKALEEKAVRRLGSTRSERIDVAFVAASNANLVTAVRQKRFRADLYHRLAVITLLLPPLRQRGDDVLLLAEQFLARACRDHGVLPRTLSHDARAALRAYSWPGNIRELRNVMERAALLSEGPLVTARTLALPGLAPNQASALLPSLEGRSMDDAVRERVRSVLAQTEGNITRAASILGVTRNTVRAHIRRFGLEMAERPRRMVGLPAAATSAVEPRPIVPGVASGPCRWDSRRIALLLVRMPAVGDSAAHAARLLSVIRDKMAIFGGHLEGIAPSTLLATFGLDALEEPIVRATHAAMASHHATGHATGHAEAKPIIAIHTVEAVMDLSTTPPTLDPEVRRQAWNALDSVIERAGPGEIVVSAPTAEFLGRRYEVRRLTGDDAVYRVVDTRRGSSHVAGPRLLVGRDHELALLRHRLAVAATGKGQVVSIAGDAGIGKSRLILAMRENLGGDAVSYVEGHCLPLGTSVPYFPVAQMLRTACDVSEEDDPDTAAHKVGQALEGLGFPAAETTPWVLQILGMRDGDPLVDPGTLCTNVVRVSRQFLLKKSRHRPVVLVIEDLQWIDPTSEAYVAALVESISAVPVLVVTTYRSGYVPSWISRSYVTQIALTPLSRPESVKVVEWLLRHENVEAELAESIAERADGNPLFLEELARALRERGSGRPQAPVPDTLTQVIRARLQGLARGTRSVLQTAAVLGRTISPALLARVHDEPGAVSAALSDLAQREFIVADSLTVHECDPGHPREGSRTDLDYAFRHALIQEVVYESVPPARRQELHEAVGLATEALYADRLEEHASVLAYHFGHSARRNLALPYALLAGDRAARLHANTEAAVYYEQALAIARPLRSTASRHAEIDAVVKLASVATTHWAVLERDRGNLLRARTLAEELGDVPRLARVLYWLGRLDYVEWRPTAALEHARQSLELAETVRDEELAALPVNLMGRIYWQQSDFARAAELLERSTEQMARLGNASEESTAAGFAGVALGYLGDFDRAMTYVGRGVDVAAAIQNPFAEASAYLYRGVVEGERGNTAVAIADFERARATAERVGDGFRVYLVKLFEGRSYILAGDPGHGRVLLEESLALASRIGSTFALAWQKSFLAEALLALGEFATVPALCQETIRLGEERGGRFPAACAHRTLAEAFVHLAPSDLERAAATFHETIQLHRALGTEPELARTYVREARLLESMGDADRARERRVTARRMFERMGMHAARELGEA